MKAKSISGKSTEEIITKVDQIIDDNFEPTLAILFLSVEQDRKAICDSLDQKGIDIFGCTTAGEFIDGNESEGEIAIMLLDINRNNYSILFEDIGKRSLENVTSNMVHDAFKKFPYN